MTLEQRIEALKVKLADKYAIDGQTGGVCEWSKESFEHGASALAEVYRLKGKIEAFQELRDLRLVDRAISSNEALVRAQLEALLAELEGGAK